MPASPLRFALALTGLLGVSFGFLLPAGAQYIAPEQRLICETGNTQGSTQSVSVTAQDSDGDPLSGEVINFSAPGQGSVSGVTNFNGQVSIRIEVPAGTQQTVRATLGSVGCSTVLSRPQEPVSEVLGSVFTPPIVGDAGLAGAR